MKKELTNQQIIQLSEPMPEREQLIIKISFTCCLVALDKINEKVAMEKIKKYAKQHGYTFTEAMIMQNQIDATLEADVLR